MDSHPSIARVRAASRIISLENLPYFVIAALVIGEIFSVIATGQSALGFLFRRLNARRKGHHLVSISGELQIAIANGLIQPGDDLIIAHDHEWAENKVTRFAILPEKAERPLGTTLFIHRIHREDFEVTFQEN